MTSFNSITVYHRTKLRDALSLMNKAGRGLLLLVRESDHVFQRTITDGDLRRLLILGKSLDSNLKNIEPIKSHVVQEGVSKREALKLMNEFNIHHLPVLDQKGIVSDILDRKNIDVPILLSTPHMGKTELQFVKDAFDTNWIAPLGPNLDAFEAELSQKVDISYAAALSSGTAAIHLGLRILGVGSGDIVFCSSLTFVASANPIIQLGAKPVFIDSDWNSWNMSPKALEIAFLWARRNNCMPKAVIIVSLYGQSADMAPLMELCEFYDVPILEDAAESLGGTYNGKACGTFGKLGVYSFNGNKIITTSGGGALVSDDKDMIDKAKFLSTQARDPALHYEHSENGYNYRMSNILAGVGRGQLEVLEDRVEARRKIFEKYFKTLNEFDFIKFMPELKKSFSTRWISTFSLTSHSPLTAEDFIEKMNTELIECRPIWKPMHLQPVFKDYEFFTEERSGSVSESLFKNGLCLPSGSNMTSDEIERVIYTAQKFLTV